MKIILKVTILTQCLSFLSLMSCGVKSEEQVSSVDSTVYEYCAAQLPDCDPSITNTITNRIVLSMIPNAFISEEVRKLIEQTSCAGQYTGAFVGCLINFGLGSD